MPTEDSNDSKDPSRNESSIKKTLSSLTSSLARAIVPKTVDGFVTYLFWHSILLIATTPLHRVMRGHWMGGASSVDFAYNTLRSHLDFGKSCSVPDNYTEEFIHNWDLRAIATMVCTEETANGGEVATYYMDGPTEFYVGNLRKLL